MKRKMQYRHIGLYSFFTVLALMVGFGLKAQPGATSNDARWVDPIEGVAVRPIFHASVELKLAGKTLLVDPSFDPALMADLAAPDLILLTDIHGDHLDIKLLSQLIAKYGEKPIIAPQAVADKMPAELKKLVKVLRNGDRDRWQDIDIEAVPMYNLQGREPIFHPKGRGNGYVITGGAKRIYISGDTEATKELRHLMDIDLAFVCMNLPYTMDVDQAASGVIDFQPKVVIPYHYRGSGGLSDTKAFKQKVEAAGKNIHVVLLNFYP